MNVLKKAISTRGGVITQNNRGLTSYMRKVVKRINNVVEGLRMSSVANEKLTEELQYSEENLDNFITATSTALARETSSSNFISQRLSMLRQAITDLAEGLLSPSLIKPEMLASAIGEIQDMLVKQYPNCRLAVKDITFYYKQASFSVIREDNKMLITIEFPIASAETFQLFKVYAFPIPVNHTSQHGTKLTHVPGYIAITDNEQFYTTLLNNEISYCKNTKQERYSRPPLSAVSKKNCIANLLLNN